MRKLCIDSRTDIENTIRKLWSQHVYWTRFFIISTAEELEDLSYVTKRLLENPGDFAQVLKRFYGTEKSEKFKNLLTEHLKIAGDLVNADKVMNTEKANILRKEWYENADQIAVFLSEINPYWDYKKWQKMMYNHLDMTEKEAAYRLKKEFPKDINMFGFVENEALEMADYMSLGIIRQWNCQEMCSQKNSQNRIKTAQIQ